MLCGVPALVRLPRHYSTRDKNKARARYNSGDQQCTISTTAAFVRALAVVLVEEVDGAVVVVVVVSAVGGGHVGCVVYGGCGECVIGTARTASAAGVVCASGCIGVAAAVAAAVGVVVVVAAAVAAMTDTAEAVGATAAATTAGDGGGGGGGMTSGASGVHRVLKGGFLELVKKFWRPTV